MLGRVDGMCINVEEYERLLFEYYAKQSKIAVIAIGSEYFWQDFCTCHTWGLYETWVTKTSWWSWCLGRVRVGMKTCCQRHTFHKLPCFVLLFVVATSKHKVSLSGNMFQRTFTMLSVSEVLFVSLFYSCWNNCLIVDILLW